MKKKSYILKIENPCTQNWTQMTASESGRFCSHCSKTVVDFTNLSDQQIIEYITLNSGKICGRLTSQQNNRTFVSSEQRGKNLTFYKFISGLLLFGTTQNFLATTKTVPTKIIESIDRKEIENKIQLTDSLNNIIKIRLIDSTTKEYIPFANIVAYKDGIQAAVATTNMDGEAIIKSLPSGKYDVKGVYVGYQATEVKDVVVNESQTTYVIIPLSYRERTKLDEVKIITYQEIQLIDFDRKSGSITREEYENMTGDVIVVEKKQNKKWLQFWKKN